MAARPSRVECCAAGAAPWIGCMDATSGPMRARITPSPQGAASQSGKAFNNLYQPGGPGPFAHALLLGRILPSRPLAGILAMPCCGRAACLDFRIPDATPTPTHSRAPAVFAVCQICDLCASLPACISPECLPCSPPALTTAPVRGSTVIC